MLKGKNILLGITGSIAAYKTPILVRLLKKKGANVKVVMTQSSKDFVSPLTLSTVSECPIYCQPFNPENGAWNSHIELAEWADLMLIAPLSANTMGKMVHGITDNLLTTTYLSARSDVMIAPAMDLDMYKHPSTKSNLKALVERGHILIEPTEGELASGLCGAGRMEEPENIITHIKNYFEKNYSLLGKKVLVTAGPTHEAIDPVRFIGNQSSGKMGFALAEEFAKRGADVTLVSGPVSIKTPDNISERIDVITADEMFEQCNNIFPEMDIAVMSAAVADYKPATIAEQKIKKDSNTNNSIQLKQTKDVLKSLGENKKKNQMLVGFALETENEIENAIKKLHKKNLDLIVLNSTNDKGATFGHSTNIVTLIDRNEHPQAFGLKHKKMVAIDIIDKIESLL